MTCISILVKTTNLDWFIYKQLQFKESVKTPQKTSKQRKNHTNEEKRETKYICKYFKTYLKEGY